MAETAYGSIAPKFLAATPGSTVTLTPLTALNWKWTPGETENVAAATGGFPGQVLTCLIATSGATSYTLTFTTNFHTTATLATGVTTARFFVITFISDGINWYETSRTAAMA